MGTCPQRNVSDAGRPFVIYGGERSAAMGKKILARVTAKKPVGKDGQRSYYQRAIVRDEEGSKPAREHEFRCGHFVHLSAPAAAEP